MDIIHGLEFLCSVWEEDQDMEWETGNESSNERLSVMKLR
jgi:hypothetical protein